MDEKDIQVWEAIRSKLFIDQELKTEWMETKNEHSFKTFEDYIDLRIIPLMKKKVKTREKEGYKMSFDT